MRLHIFSSQSGISLTVSRPSAQSKLAVLREPLWCQTVQCHLLLYKVLYFVAGRLERRWLWFAFTVKRIPKHQTNRGLGSTESNASGRVANAAVGASLQPTSWQSKWLVAGSGQVRLYWSRLLQTRQTTSPSASHGRRRRSSHRRRCREVLDKRTRRHSARCVHVSVDMFLQYSTTPSSFQRMRAYNFGSTFRGNERKLWDVACR